MTTKKYCYVTRLRIESLPAVGRVTPCAPFGKPVAICGAHGVTRPTKPFTECSMSQT